MNVHMKGGEGKTSYANNSLLQRSRISATKPFIEEAILNFFDTKTKSFNIADLGCSSGPNSLFAIDMILDAAYRKCKDSTCSCLEFQVFLNDLFGNDFSSTFKFIPSLHEKFRDRNDGLGGRVFVSATPGSFYGRLFASESLHFVYSSSCLHWLSQVPPLLEDSTINKGNINLATTSSSIVFEAYLAQFQKDFALFLESRLQELATGGCMVLSLSGRKMLNLFDKECQLVYEDLASVMRDLVAEGVVEEAKMDSFNVPYYPPHIEELREVIRAEGSFNIIRLEALPHNMIEKESILRHTKAAMEPMLATHFGHEATNTLFEKLEERVTESSHITIPLVASLVRRA